MEMSLFSSLLLVTSIAFFFSQFAQQALPSSSIPMPNIRLFFQLRSFSGQRSWASMGKIFSRISVSNFQEVPNRPNSREEEGKYVYAYCHGFLSNRNSFKGTFLRDIFEKKGLNLELLNLNGGPDASSLTYSGALQSIERYFDTVQENQGDEVKLRLIGSSLGGYIAARFAEMHPEKVDRILLLCPGFNLGGRWPKLFGEQTLADWEKYGSKEFVQQDGKKIQIPYKFIEDGLTQPAFPKYQCPCTVIHGINDEVIPIKDTKVILQDGFLSKRTTVYFVDDDHALTTEPTLKLTAEVAEEFFNTPHTKDKKLNPKVETSSTIEVEKKFESLNPSNLEALMGKNMIAEVIFYDSYWDTPGSLLMKADFWLRNRSGLWQLKYPIEHGRTATMNDCSATSYSECNDEKEIKALLQRNFPDTFQDWSHEIDFSSWVANFNIEMFAEFQTTRTKFKVDGCTVDIDSASHGFQIIEVERLCNNSSEIQENLNLISQLASKLSLVETKTKAGKLENYITRFCPDKLKILQEKK